MGKKERYWLTCFFLSLIIFLNDSLIHTHTHTSLHIATYTQVHVCASNQNKGNVYMNLKESKKASWKGFEEGKTKIKDVKIPYMYIYANMLILIYITLYLIIVFKHHLTYNNNSFSWEEKNEFKYISIYISSVYSYDEISS